MGSIEVVEEYKTIVDELLERWDSDERIARTRLDVVDAERTARELLEYLSGYDANMAEFEGAPPTIVVRLGKFVIYLVVLSRGMILTGIRSLRIIESLLDYMLTVKEHGFKPTLLFYSRKGWLTRTAYLFLGAMIESYEIGILYVNGKYDEVLEILWSLENKGSFTPEEEDKVEV